MRESSRWALCLLWVESGHRLTGTKHVPVLVEEQQEEGPMTRSPLLLSVAALLLPACQAGEKPGNNTAEVNSAAAVNIGADEQAIRGQVDRWLQLVKAKDAAGIA